MKNNGVIRFPRCTQRYGDSKGGHSGVKNHNARSARPREKLLELLCDAGERSEGKACAGCEAQCGFGLAYMENGKKAGAANAE